MIKDTVVCVKAAMFHRFREIMRQADLHHLAELHTYEQAKQSCHNYLTVKQGMLTWWWVGVVSGGVH